MGNFISFITIIAFSINSFAQVEFGALIEKSITQQSETATDIKQATQMANNIDGEGMELGTPDDSVKTIKTGDATNTTQTQKPNEQRAPASDKEFSVKLHATGPKPETGRASAAKYFPYVPKAKKSAKLKHKSGNKIAKVTKTGKIKKSKSNGRSTASVTKKTKPTKNKNKKATGKVASH